MAVAKETLRKMETELSEGEFNAAYVSLINYNLKQFKVISLLQKMEADVNYYMRMTMFDKALRMIGTLIVKMNKCLRVRLLQIECILLLNGNSLEAHILYLNLPNVIKHEDKAMEIYISALIGYYDGKMEIAEEKLESLHAFTPITPAHEKGKELRGNLKRIKIYLKCSDEFLAVNNVDKSVQMLIEASKIDPRNKALGSQIAGKRSLIEAKNSKSNRR